MSRLYTSKLIMCKLWHHLPTNRQFIKRLNCLNDSGSPSAVSYKTIVINFAILVWLPPPSSKLNIESGDVSIQVRYGGIRRSSVSSHPPCDDNTSAFVWPSPRQMSGPWCPYPSNRPSPDATMKPVDAPWSSKVDWKLVDKSFRYFEYRPKRNKNMVKLTLIFPLNEKISFNNVSSPLTRSMMAIRLCIVGTAPCYLHARRSSKVNLRGGGGHELMRWWINVYCYSTRYPSLYYPIGIADNHMLNRGNAGL